VTDQQPPPIEMHDCYPGGNSTYICFAPGCKREQYAELDAAIRTRFPHFEQGGFIEPPVSDKAVLRLQMAGGEFCGNAARSFGALIADAAMSQKVLSPQIRQELVASTGEGAVSFPIEISGTEELLTVHCHRQNGGYWVETEVPVPGRLAPRQHQIVDEADGLTFTVLHVALPGIDHLLINERDFAFPGNTGNIERLLRTAERLLALSASPAIGLIWYSHQPDNGAVINPVVYVRSTNSLVNETACGSGSIALHLAVSTESSLDVMQPSGSTLKTTIQRSKDGSIDQVLLSGEVRLQGCQSFPADQLAREPVGEAQKN